MVENQTGGTTSSILYDCILTGNLGGCHGTFFNCTVVDNQGGVSGTAFNSIVYYNSWGNYTEEATLNYRCATPMPTTGVGNITNAPLFVNAAGRDFRLLPDSPCIDAGTNLLGFPIMGYDSNWNWGVVVGHITNPTDILGNTRFIDGNGNGSVAWDIGAYDFSSFKPPRFIGAPRRTAEGWKLNVTGEPNKWTRGQRSSTLRDWQDIWSGFMGAEGSQQITDSETNQMMFYRVVVP